MSIANDRLYRYLVEQGGALIGAIETTGPVAVGETIDVNHVTHTVTAIKDSSPKQTITPVTDTRYLSVSHWPPVLESEVGYTTQVNHGYITRNVDVITEEAGYNTHHREKVLVV